MHSRPRTKRMFGCRSPHFSRGEMKGTLHLFILQWIAGSGCSHVTSSESGTRIIYILGLKKPSCSSFDGLFENRSRRLNPLALHDSRCLPRVSHRQHRPTLSCCYKFLSTSTNVTEWYITRAKRGCKGFYPRVWRNQPRGHPEGAECPEGCPRG